MAFFDYNAEHTDGHDLLYQEFPTRYVFSAKTRSWTPCQKGDTIGRMYHCNPLAGEKFYLRLLLTVIRGPQSFKHICTGNNVVYDTFQEACVALGLTHNNREWMDTFTEAITFASGESLRRLLVTALVHGDLADATSVWNQFRDSFCDDLEPRMLRYDVPPPDLEDPKMDLGLFLLNELLLSFCHSLKTFALPSYQHEWHQRENNQLIVGELDYDMADQEQQRKKRYEQLNTDQKQAFNEVVAAITQDPHTAHFFLQGAGGTGKPFLYTALCHHFCAQGKTVLCVASSGIAAELLPDGQTSHSQFQIPLNIHQDSTTMITGTSQAAKLMQRAALIIWDEVPMQHKYCFEAVHRTLCDVRGSTSLFGGLPAILEGDFAQILPVVKNGTRASIVNA